MKIPYLSAFYAKHQICLDNLIIDEESNAYSACSFSLDSKRIVYRKANTTPKKIGQFVAIWKRNKLGETAPYQDTDSLDALIIAVETATHRGQFIFPRELLVKKNILSSSTKLGKRGIRVYPSWDTPTNKQAIKTQQWQLDYFVNFNEDAAQITKELKERLSFNVPVYNRS